MAPTNRSRFAILGMLAFEPHTGYEIKKVIEENFSVFWSESYGQIYKVLAQLVKDKAITKKHVAQKSKPSKNIYSITKKGQKELNAYLLTPPEKLIMRDEMILKFVLGFHTSKEQNIKLLKSELETLQIALDKNKFKTKEIQKKCNSGLPGGVYLKLLCQLGERYLNTRISWCQEAIKTINKEIK